MAKTITQIQQMITDKYDQREVINEIADYIQANPGGGVRSVTGSPITVNFVWAGSQAQYNAIVTPDANTIYFIVP